MYSEYCNNHPHAVNEMNLLQQDQQYLLFFEVMEEEEREGEVVHVLLLLLFPLHVQACRLLKGMADISLEGFLLNPVQRICRYPLQLSVRVAYYIKPSFITHTCTVCVCLIVLLILPQYINFLSL